MANPDLLASAQKEYRSLKRTMMGRVMGWMFGLQDVAKAILTKMPVYGQELECDEADDGGAYRATIPLDLLTMRKCAKLLDVFICLNGNNGPVDEMAHTIHKNESFGAYIVLRRVGDDLFQVFYRCWRHGSYY